MTAFNASCLGYQQVVSHGLVLDYISTLSSSFCLLGILVTLRKLCYSSTPLTFFSAVQFFFTELVPCSGKLRKAKLN